MRGYLKISRWAALAAAIGIIGLVPVSRAAGSGPPCTKHAARLATSHSSLGRMMRHRFGIPGHPNSGDPTDARTWAISALICANLGTGQRDMAVEFICCTADTPTPLAVFRPRAGQWHLAYAYAGLPPVYQLKRAGLKLTGKQPIYKPSDPLCCPSHMRAWSLTYTGHRFVAHHGA